MKKTIFNYILIFIIANIFGMLIQTEQEKNNFKNRINNYLTKSVSNGFSGAVLVAKNSKFILNKDYCSADKEKGIHNTSSTVFDVCSVSKQFATAAIL
jgi:CubicO group peptidase (beta-lactamase class C family)